MKKLIISTVFFCQSIIGSAAVTYTFSGGRFGDNLLAYCHAKWVAYKFKIPLLYKPFAYSDQLMMHVLEPKYDDSLARTFNSVVAVYNLNQINAAADCLYVVSYFPESLFELTRPHFAHYFVVDWNDPVFKAELQKMLAPLTMPALIQPPQGYFSVAVHVRKGTGYDISTFAEFDKLCADSPFKMPPDSFYIAQIKRIAHIYRGKPLYVYLFTDHNNPAEIVEQYQSQLQDQTIVFDYRKTKNTHNANVLEDFYSLMNFDCLIRPDSNFSLIASKISDHQLIIYPSRCLIKDGHVFITETTEVVRENIAL
jgi:hypothetical protein